MKQRNWNAVLKKLKKDPEQLMSLVPTPRETEDQLLQRQLQMKSQIAMLSQGSVAGGALEQGMTELRQKMSVSQAGTRNPTGKFKAKRQGKLSDSLEKVTRPSIKSNLKQNQSTNLII